MEETVIMAQVILGALLGIGGTVAIVLLLNWTVDAWERRK